MILNLEKVYQKAEEKNEAEALVENMFILTHLLNKNAETQSLLTNKQIGNDIKVEIMLSLPDFKLSTVFNDVLKVIVENNQIKHINTIYRNLSELMSEKKKIAFVQVETAVDISETVISSIKTQLEQIFKIKMRIKHILNPDIIAGVVVSFPNGKVFDMSYQRMLSELKQHLREKR